MSLPPVIRIFFAIDLPESAKTMLGDFISTLKKASKTNGIRWTRPENLHITLQFLATVKTEDIPALVENVRARMVEAIKHSRISLGSLHLFPNPYKPRVIVIDIVPQDDLVILSRLVGDGIKATHYETEARAYRAHLTLGRIKQPQGINLGILSDCEVPQLGKIEVSEVVLFRSEPQMEGSRYTVMERIAV
jgi:2'-5' RNA ligase